MPDRIASFCSTVSVARCFFWLLLEDDRFILNKTIGPKVSNFDKIF